MEYDVQRALILLKDLERAAQNNGPAVKLNPPGAEVPCVHGDATRAGVLRLAVQLAYAALLESHSTPIRVTADGHVGRAIFSEAPAAEILRLELVDDPPPRAQQSRGSWLDPSCSLPLAALAILAFAVVGFVHTIRWLVQ